MVAELNFNLLENIHGWTVALHGKAYCTGYFTGSFAAPIDLRKPRNLSTLNDLQHTV